jgi:hypothetical protein
MKPTFQMRKELDFTLEGTEKRLKQLDDIVSKYDDKLVDYYDNHYIANKTSTSFEQDIIGQDLEKLADYLLYADNKEQRQKTNKHKDERGILSRSQIERNARKETLTDDLSYFEKSNENLYNQSFYTKEKRFKNKMQCNEEKPKKRKAKQKNRESKKVTKEDLEKYPVLKDQNEAIQKLKKEVETGLDSHGQTLSEEQLRKKRWLMIELKKDQVAYKDTMKKYVNAKSVINPTKNGNFDINFRDQEVIEFLFYEYSHLKQQCFDDLTGDLKHVLMDFEQLVDATPFSEIVKEVFILKIDGLSRDQIIKELEHKYEITFSKQHISTLIRNTIPKKIIDTFSKKLEDWYYLEIVKGTYKTCLNCGQIKLANENYFRRESKGKYGVRATCKICDSAK